MRGVSRSLRHLCIALDSLHGQIRMAAEKRQGRSRLLISFSGGETSAYMTQWLLKSVRHLYDEIIIVFANTGQENEETLVFVDECDRLLFAPLGGRVVWIEAVQFHGERRSAGFRIVDFDTASRDGAPFEDAIKKYGIPNSKFKDCTRNLKLRPIENYAKSIGWANGSYDLAIGIRSDEIDRMSSQARIRRIIYPLVQMIPTTKIGVNTFWRDQPFRLKLKGYQGNCKWCWKKTLRKHLTLIQENPSTYDFPRRMEREYGKVGPEFRHDPATRKSPLPADYRRTFFRGNTSVDDLFAEYERRRDNFTPSEDDAVVYDDELDIGGGCEESCEVFADEDMAAVFDEAAE